MKLLFAIPLAASIAACSPRETNRPVQAEAMPVERVLTKEESALRAAVQKAQQKDQRIESIRQADPKLNWIHIGISTYKVSESTSSGVYKTYKECVAASYKEANECIPMAALPESYWSAGGDKP